MTENPPVLPALSAIAAMAENRVIGRAGALPWHHPEDLKFFKRTTLGHPVLMGRTTYESIGRPLPGRLNLVLSRTLPKTPGVTVLRCLEDLPAACAGADRVFVIGGAQLYAALLPRCEELYLTLVRENPEGDAFMPPFESLFGPPEILGETSGLVFQRYRRRAQP